MEKACASAIRMQFQLLLATFVLGLRASARAGLDWGAVSNRAYTQKGDVRLQTYPLFELADVTRHKFE